MGVVREVEVAIGEPDLIAAQHMSLRANLRDPRKLAPLVALWIVGATMLILLLHSEIPTPLPVTALLAGILMGCACVGTPVVIVGLFAGRRARRSLRDVPAFSAPLRYHWTDEGFGCATISGHSFQHWNSFHRWLDGDALMLLWPNSRTYQLLPKRSFTPEQIDDIRSLLSARPGT